MNLKNRIRCAELRVFFVKFVHLILFKSTRLNYRIPYNFFFLVGMLGIDPVTMIKMCEQMHLENIIPSTSIQAVF